MIKVLRLILFIPTMYLGGFLSLIANTVLTMPLTLLEKLASHLPLFYFEYWFLFKTFNKFDISLFEIIYVFGSGFFTALIGIYLALLVFPYVKWRGKIIHLLFVILILGYASPSQLSIYDGNITLFLLKIFGIILGYLVICFLYKDNGNQFDFIDKYKKAVKEKTNINTY